MRLFVAASVVTLASCSAARRSGSTDCSPVSGASFGEVLEVPVKAEGGLRVWISPPAAPGWFAVYSELGLSVVNGSEALSGGRDYVASVGGVASLFPGDEGVALDVDRNGDGAPDLWMHQYLYLSPFDELRAEDAYDGSLSTCGGEEPITGVDADADGSPDVLFTDRAPAFEVAYGELSGGDMAGLCDAESPDALGSLVVGSECLILEPQLSVGQDDEGLLFVVGREVDTTIHCTEAAIWLFRGPIPPGSQWTAEDAVASLHTGAWRSPATSMGTASWTCGRRICRFGMGRSMASSSRPAIGPREWSR